MGDTFAKSEGSACTRENFEGCWLGQVLLHCPRKIWLGTWPRNLHFIIARVIFVDFDLFISGFTESQAFMNGRWVQRGEFSTRSYYVLKKRRRVLYWIDRQKRWIFSKKLGDESKWAAYSEEDLMTPDGILLWKVWNKRTKSFVDSAICLERELSESFRTHQNARRFWSIWFRTCLFPPFFILFWEFSAFAVFVRFQPVKDLG